MKLISRIDRVSSYSGKSNYYVQEDRLIGLADGRSLILDSKYYAIFYFTENIIWAFDYASGKSLIISGRDFKIENRFEILTASYPYIIFRKTLTSPIYGVYNYCLNSTVFELNEWIGRDIISDFVLSDDQSQITCRRLNSNNPLWQFSLNSLGEYTTPFETASYRVLNFIGEYEGKLIVQLSNVTLLLLDMVTGSMVKIIHLNSELPTPPAHGFSDGYPPHLVGDHLLWLNNQRYLTVNLSTFEIAVVKDYFEGPRESQYRFMSSTYFEGKIYFVADYAWQYVVPTRIGVMDANTGDVLWQQQLQKTGGLPEPPQVTQEKLYVRTTKGTLYIFENEYA